ncbi:MAG TPA: RNA polymerase sigma factor [Steroidobacteraceae bacterium]
MNATLSPSLADAEAQSRRWIERIALGEEAALEQFYRHYHGQVFQFALRLVNNAADAAELANETMMEVWRAAARFAGDSRVRTWLFGIVNHRAIDLLRRRRRRHEHAEELDDVADDAPACSISDVIGGAQDARHVRSCVEQLPERQKAVVHLAFFEELSYPEVAQVLDVPVGTIKTRVMHAKQRLLHCLAGLFARGST